MANGPMGGFMPTPAAPAQPPSVKLDTTAASRGTFNEFLRNMNGAMNPPLAPMVGAVAPTLAPTMSDIDIFNPPMQMMQEGGFVDDFGDFASAGDFSIGDTEDRSQSDSFQDALDSIDLSSSDDSMFADDPSSATPMGLTMPSGQNLSSRTLPKINFTNKTIEEAFDRLNVPQKTRKELRADLQDRAKNNDIIGALDAAQKDSAEFDRTSLGEKVVNSIIQASNVNPVDFSRKAFNVEDVLGDVSLSGLGEGDPRLGIDLFENIVPDPAVAQRNFQTGLPGANLPTIGSTRSTVAQDQARAIANLVGGSPALTDVERGLQQNQQELMAQRGRALGPITFSDDLAGGTGRSDPFVGPDLDALRSERATFDTIFDPDTYKGPTKDIPNVGMIGGRRDPKLTIADDTDPREDTLGVLPAQTIADIERLSNVPVGQRKAGPGSDPAFFQGLGLPSFFDGIERFSRDRMAAKLARGDVPEDRIVRNDSGRVVALKDQFGRTVEGVDPNEPIGGGDDNQEPIIRRPIIPPKEEEKKDDDRPPNIIGGGAPRPVPEPIPTVVASPFAPATSTIEPVTFDSGQLNKLIELLTGVSAKPVVSAQEGGLIRAVDDFLATGT